MMDTYVEDPYTNGVETCNGHNGIERTNSEDYERVHNQEALQKVVNLFRKKQLSQDDEDQGLWLQLIFVRTI